MKLRIAFFSLMAASMLLVSCGGDKTAKDAAHDAITSAPAAAPTAADPNAAATPPAPAVPAGPTTTMEFAESDFNFGTVKAGEKVEHVYKFKNTGKEPLIISDAKGSCGCTVPEWPKEPIAPGATGEILVSFDSANKNGEQSKSVTITANTEPAQTFLKITGNVKGTDPAPAAPAPAPAGAAKH